MELLYKAYACENINGGKYLLPGYPVTPDSKRVQSGAKIHVELADGTGLQTTAVKSDYLDLTESVMTHLNVRAQPGFYLAVQVPDDFSPEAVNLGIKVFLDD